MDAEQVEPFGFAVTKVKYRYGPETYRNEYGGTSYVKRELDPPHWDVSLPHQCDSWQITGGHGQGSPQAAAIADLERFIGEAQEALTALREGREIEPD